MASKDKKKARVGIIMEPDVREAMLVIREVVRILPSHQVDLALREYFKQHRDVLAKKGIKV